MATARLYYDSATLSFDATITRVDGDPSRVVLDRTAFYPTSGGQPHDIGGLNGIAVVDVIDADEDVIHVLAAPLAEGAVHGEVDAARRTDFTVQHSAQHVLSALAADRLGWETNSVHFGEDQSTIEFTTDVAPAAALRDLERWSAEAVAAALPVSVGYENAEAATGLRKPPPRSGVIRVITIAGLDRSACGGTHVTSTAAVGSILIRGAERIRGRVRVGFLAGNRVMDLLRRHDNLLAIMAADLSCSPEDLPDLVTRRGAALRDAEARIATLEREVAVLEAARLLGVAVPDADGVTRIVVRNRGGSIAGLRLVAQVVAEHPGAYFVGTMVTPPTIVVASHHDTGIDANGRLKSALAVVGGRGGGSSRLSQGTVADVSQLDPIVSAVMATD